MLHESEVQKKVSQDKVLEIVEEVSKEDIAGLRRHVEVRSLNVNGASVEEIASWVRSVRLFKKMASKN